jgi:hypothetical protein
MRLYLDDDTADPVADSYHILNHWRWLPDRPRSSMIR